MLKKIKPLEKQNPEVQPREDIDPYLHTEKQHKDWYNRPIMGNLGDPRGHLKRENTKVKRSAHRTPKGKKSKV